MATLYVQEYARLGKDGASDGAQAAMQPSTVDQAVTISGTSAQSSAFGASTTLVRVCSDTACWILFGANPTATATKTPLAANAPEYFCVPANSGLKVAAITA